MRKYRSMQYKTRGNASPQGRPRVFFCCAAADFDRLFEPVTEELLAAQPNAAIWYLAPGEGAMAGEAFLADLSQMQLLVVPVTTAFLRQDRPDPARTVAFRYAVEHHIPVLPLMQEPGLGQAFNEICGDLQYLDKTAQDPTALPYAEKLRRFLEGVLVSDALAKRVRAAFDAYIFLSYRKKDRAAAQKLMRLIHENEFCRDVAIWYDEFLTPGENFNRAIEEAMKKSALFALVVTPNLLEDPNYVLTTEYPAAKRMEKKILPFEAEPTDFGELARLYDGVREVVPTGDPAEISRRLRALLVETALRKNDDPAHTFLMGVAYLSGIDMEVNHARAVQLITVAAEAGLPEAMEKLVSMYKTGEGVERNERTAIAWRYALVKSCSAAAERDPSDRNLDNLSLSLCDLGDELRAVGALPGAEAAYEALRDCAERMRVRGYPKAQSVFAVSEERLGDVSRDLGHMEKALQWYQIALERREPSAGPKERMERAFLCGRLGDVCHRHLKRPVQALAWYRQALDITERLAAETRTAPALRALSVSYDRLGHAELAAGRAEQALAWYRESLKLREPFAAKDSPPEARRDLAASCRNLGDACRALGRPEEARAWYQKDLALSEALADETRTIQARRDLAVSCGMLGEISAELGALREAREWYGRELEICQTLAAETGTQSARRDLIVCCEKLGDLLLAENRPGEAMAWYQRELELSAARAEETGTAEAWQALSFGYGKLGDVCLQLDRPDEALAWYRKGTEISEALAAQIGSPEMRRDLAVCCEKLGDAEHAAQNGAEALSQYRRAYALREAIASENGSLQALDDLAVSCFKLGTLERLPASERRQYLLRLQQLSKTLLLRSDRERYRQFYAGANRQLAELPPDDEA